MRLVVGLFAMFLTASAARADEANSPEPQAATPRTKVSLRVVKLLPESHQALLFDKNRGTHVLAEVGGTVDGYKVEDIDDDEVTLSANGKEIVLTAPAPDPSWRRGRGGREAEPTRAKAPAKAETAPQDPYGEPGAPAADAQAADAPADAPIDPYADAPVRSVAAPSVRVTAPASLPAILPAAGLADPYADVPAPAPRKTGPAVIGFEPPGTTAATRATPAPAAARAAPTNAPTAPAAAPTEIPAADEITPEAPPAPVITPTVLSRSELNVALADFNKLATVLRGSFTPAGARLDVVAEGSVFSKAGLRSGDIVTAVDGTPLKTIDDAAELYVRASATRAANIQLIRAGKPLTLRVLIQ